MRVLAVTNMYPTPDLPGNGVFVQQQVQGLQSLGIEVKVLFIDRRHNGVGVYRRTRPMVKRELAEFTPDLVHLMYGGVMARQATSIWGLPPTLVTFHGSDLLGENLSGLVRKMISRYGVHCSRKAARRVQAVIVVASHLISALGKKVSREKICVLPCGIDLERFQPLDQGQCQQQLGWRADTFHVLFATSTGDPVKRPELARAAVASLKSTHGNSEFHILSGVPNEQVPVWLNAADVLLLTSMHEGSPTVIKEALACGLPVVSVPVGDVVERIGDISGCYLADAEPRQLAGKLKLVYEHRHRLDCRSQLEAMSLPSVARKLERIYLDVLSAWTASHQDARRLELLRRNACLVSSSR